MCRLKVLSVGLSALTTLRDALMLRAHSKLAVVSNYWDLCSMSLLQAEDFQVAVLNDRSSARELRRRVRYIRRTWPGAAIVLMGAGPEDLDPRLYDQRVASRIGPADLLAVIDRLNWRAVVEPAA